MVVELSGAVVPPAGAVASIETEIIKKIHSHVINYGFLFCLHDNSITFLGKTYKKFKTTLTNLTLRKKNVLSKNILFITTSYIQFPQYIKYML